MTAGSSCDWPCRHAVTYINNLNQCSREDLWKMTMAYRPRSLHGNRTVHKPMHRCEAARPSVTLPQLHLQQEVENFIYTKNRNARKQLAKPCRD
jgi:hypothetical protein